MAGETSKHLIQAIYQVKGWNLYKQTIDKSGKVINRVYKSQVKEGNKVATMTKNITDKTQKMTTTFTKAAGGTNDLMKALKRAAIVAPVWLALRSIMMKTIRTITDGAKAWEDWDRALIKSKAVIHTTSMTISDAYIRLQDEVEELSLKTGVSLAKVTNAFYRFGTLGIDFEDSLAGMTASMDIALSMGGDLEQVARPLAFAYKLLGDTMDQTRTPLENLTELGGKMFAIWKINAFEINEFSQSLNNFLPTANTANFTLEETVTLLTALSSSAILGARGGRLLRQSVLRLVANLDSLASELGIAVNPQLESTNDILLKVLGRIKELGESGSIQQAGKALTAIFGGARMGEAARGLISVFDLIQENINITSASGETLDTQMKKYADRLKEVEESLHRQREIGRNLTTQLGRTFLKGIFGGEKYAETIQNINKIKKDMMPLLKDFGSSIRNIFTVGYEVADVYLKVLDKIKDKQGKLIPVPEEESKDIRQDIELVYRDTETGIEFKSHEKMLAFQKLQIEYEEVEAEAIKRINYENQIKLNLLQASLEINKLEALGVSKSQIAYKKLTDEVKERINQFNNLADLEKLGFEKLEEKQILLALERREYEKILELTGEQIFNQDKLHELAKMQADVEKAAFKENQARIALLMRHEIDLAKIGGATAAQQMEMNIAMNRQLGINQDALSLLKNQLALEKEITKEKQGQTKLSSETVKLYEIAEKYGYGYATAIGRYLQGQMQYIGGEAEMIMRKEMPGKYMAKKAERAIRMGIFRQVLPEEEYLTPGYMPPKADISKIQKRAELPKVPAVIPKVDISTTVQNIEVNLPEGSLENMAEHVGNTVKDFLLADEKYQKDLMGKLRKFA